MALGAMGGSTAVANILFRVQNQASREFANLAKDYDAAAANMEATTARVNAAASSLGSFALRAGIVGTVIAGVTGAAATQFDAAKVKVQAFAQVSAQQMAIMTAAILKMSGQYGVSAENMMQGLYRLASTHVATGKSMQNWLTITEQAAKLSSAANMNYATSMQAITAVLKEFNVPAKDTSLYIDKIAAAIKNDAAAPEEWARGIATALPAARSLHVGFDEIAASIGVLTSRGISFRYAAQAVNSVVLKMENPIQKAQNAAKMLGYNWQDLYDVKGKGLVRTLEDVIAASKSHTVSAKLSAEATNLQGSRMGRLAEQLQDPARRLMILTGNAMSYNIAQRLVGAGGKDLQKILFDISHSAGSLNDAWDEAKTHSAVAFKQIKESIHSASIELGDVLLPALVPVAQGFANVGLTAVQMATAVRPLTNVVVLASVGLFSLGLALKGIHAVASTAGQGLTAINQALVLLGARNRADVDELQRASSMRSLNTKQIDLQRASLEKLRLEEIQAQAVAAGNAKEAQKLGAELVNVETRQKALASAVIDLTAKERDLKQTTSTIQTAMQNEKQVQADLTKAISSQASALGSYGAAKREANKLSAEAVVQQNLERSMLSDLKLKQDATTAAENAATAAGKVRLGSVKAVTAARNDQKVAEQAYAAQLAKVTVVQDASNAQVEKMTAAQKKSVAETVAMKDAQKALAANQAIVANADTALVAKTDALAASEIAASGAAIDLNAALKASWAAAAQATVAFIGLDVALGPIEAPLWLIVAAIAAVVIGFKLAFDNVKWFHDGVMAALGGLANFINATFTKIEGLVVALGIGMGALGNIIGDVVQGIQENFHTIAIVLAIVLWPLTLVAATCYLVAKGVVWLVSKLGFLSAAFNAVKSAASAVGGFFTSLGSKLDGLAGGHEKAATAAEKHRKAEQKLADQVKQTAQDLAKSHAAWLAMISSTDKEIIGLKNDAATQLKSMDDAVTITFGHIAQTAITQAHATHRAWSTELSALAAEAPLKIAAIKLAPLKIPIDIQPVEKTAWQKLAMDKTTSQTLASGDIPAATKKVFTDMTAAINGIKNLPPDLKAAGLAMVEEQAKKLQAEHNTYLQKENAENRRHALEMDKIHQSLHDKLKALYQNSNDQLKSLNQDYLSKLKALNDEHAAKVSQYLQQQITNNQNSQQSFNAKMAGLTARQQEIQQRANAAHDALYAKYKTALDNHTGTFDKQARARLKANYDQGVGLIKKHEASQLGVVDKAAIKISKAYDDSAGKNKKSVHDWLANQDKSLRTHAGALATKTEQHAARIQSSTNQHATRIENAAKTQAANEASTWKYNLATMKQIFDGHVTKLNTAFAKITAPGNLFAALKTQADNLAKTSLNALAAGFYEGAKNIKELTAAAHKQAAESKKFSDAEAKAKFAMADATGKVNIQLAKFASNLDTKVKNALNKFTYDTIHHTGDLAKDRAELVKAAKAQGDYNKTLAVGQKIIDDANKAAKDTRHPPKPKKEKAPDLTPFQTALDKVTKTMDTKLKEATNALTLAYYNGSVSVSQANAMMAKSAAEGEKMAQAKEKADNAQLQAEFNAAKKAGDFATALDKGKQIVNNNLNKGLAYAAAEFMKTGTISAATTQKLQAAQAQVDAYTKAEKAATDAAQGVTKSFKDMQSDIDGKATEALDAYSQALYEQSQGIKHTAAELADLQQKAANAASKSQALADAEANAKKQVDLLNEANKKDINSALAVAKAKEEEAVATYENAIYMKNVTGPALQALHDAALAATEGVKSLEKTISDVTDGLSTEADDALGITEPGAPTQQQQIQDQIDEQRLQQQEQQNQAKDALEQQKLDLQQQKLSSSSAQKSATTQNDLTQQLLDEFKKNNQYQSEIIASQQRLIYLGALGLQRASVTGTDYTQFLSKWASDSSANPGIPT